jgi:hypothetical protein
MPVLTLRFSQRAGAMKRGGRAEQIRKSSAGRRPGSQTARRFCAGAPQGSLLLAVHGLRFMACGSWLAVHGLRFTVRHRLNERSPSC